MVVSYGRCFKLDINFHTTSVVFSGNKFSSANEWLRDCSSCLSSSTIKRLRSRADLKNVLIRTYTSLNRIRMVHSFQYLSLLKRTAQCQIFLVLKEYVITVVHVLNESEPKLLLLNAVLYSIKDSQPIFQYVGLNQICMLGWYVYVYDFHFIYLTFYYC